MFSSSSFREMTRAAECRKEKKDLSVFGSVVGSLNYFFLLLFLFFKGFGEVHSPSESITGRSCRIVKKGKFLVLDTKRF